jgi:hypothetical protein
MRKIVTAALAVTMLTGSALAGEWWHIEAGACQNQDFDPSRRLGPSTPADAYESIRSQFGYAPALSDDGMRVDVCIDSQFSLPWYTTEVGDDLLPSGNRLQCLIYYRTRVDCEARVQVDVQAGEARKARAEAEQRAEEQKLAPYR